MKYLTICLSILLATSSMAHTANSPGVTREQLQEEHAYFSIETVFPGQTRFSQLNVDKKTSWLEKTKAIRWDAKNQRWEMHYDEGRSPLALDKAVPLVRAPFGYVLVDGHHDTLSAIEVGAKTIPGKVILDLSSLTEEGFWQEMENRGLAFRYTLSGKKINPPQSFADLEDDTNRYFAALIARKYPSNNSQDSFGAEYPVWLKVGRSVPFIEFIISDALNRGGVQYTYAMGDNPPEELIERARQVLKQANIPHLPVVYEKTHYSEIVWALE